VIDLTLNVALQPTIVLRMAQDDGRAFI